MEKILKIEGMMCNHCVMHVQKALAAVPGVTEVTVSLDIDPAIEKTMVTTARSYTAEIFRKLRERGYDPRLMRLTVVGGGGCLIRHFGQDDRSRVTIQPDICAAAKGYEHLAALTMGKGERTEHQEYYPAAEHGQRTGSAGI